MLPFAIVLPSRPLDADKPPNLRRRTSTSYHVVFATAKNGSAVRGPLYETVLRDPPCRRVDLPRTREFRRSADGRTEAAARATPGEETPGPASRVPSAASRLW